MVQFVHKQKRGPTLRQVPGHISLMASPLRLELAGGLYYVTSRGSGGQDIYVWMMTEKPSLAF